VRGEVPSQTISLIRNQKQLLDMEFDTKIVVILRDDLASWQKLNVTAFTISGIAGTEQIVGENYVDASGNIYLPMSRQPILIFSANMEKMREVYGRAMKRGMRISIYTEELFKTFNDEDNRAEVAKVKGEDLNLVGMAIRSTKRQIDTVVKGLALHP
jgi:hypothetical protein